MDWIVAVTLYGLMAFSQICGPQIIGFFHGAEAMELAVKDVAGSADIRPDTAIAELCAAYEKAHFDAVSDILHAGGMLATLALLIMALFYRRSGGLPLLVSLPPVYYLPAWVGHFWLQRDIPAVFTYGTTLRGLASGEYCAWVALMMGRSIHSLTDMAKATLFAVFILGLLHISQNISNLSEKQKRA